MNEIRFYFYFIYTTGQPVIGNLLLINGVVINKTKTNEVLNYLFK